MPDLDGIDDRFQFAAACAELVGALEALGAGRDFITRLPIQFDASCSGLQHLCAMARANEGRYVNIGPMPQPRYVTDEKFGVVEFDHYLDIYGLVQAEVSLLGRISTIRSSAISFIRWGGRSPRRPP